MRVLWCSISAHGFGHAAQLAPVLNDLGAAIDGLEVILRTQVPAEFFQRHLRVKWDIQEAQQDVGCIQRGPLDIDVSGTWDAHLRFHKDWERKVDEEAEAISAAGPDLVISNISYLAIAGAARAHRPVVAMASLSWDRVLEPYKHKHLPSHQSILATIRNGYACTDQLIRLCPGIDMPAFPSVVDVGPSVPSRQAPSGHLRKLLGVPDEERLVLIAFGGVALPGLPLEQMEKMMGFQFLVSDIPTIPGYARVHRMEDLPMTFSEISQQADIVMTKPGYGTVVDAVHHGQRLVYVRRGTFIDEQPLVDYIHRYGRGIELSRVDFESGNWEKALWAVLSVPDPSEIPPQPGNTAIVQLLRKHLRM